MGGKINLGDRFFNAERQGRLSQDKPTDKFIRFSGGRTNAVLLETLGAIATVNLNCPINVNKKIITIHNIFTRILFNDQAVASYDVSRRGFITLSQDDVVNNDFTGPAYAFSTSENFNDLQLKMQVTSLNQIPVTVSIYGGDVLRETGITPAVGDFVSIDVNFSYY